MIPIAIVSQMHLTDFATPSVRCLHRAQKIVERKEGANIAVTNLVRIDSMGLLPSSYHTDC